MAAHYHDRQILVIHCNYCDQPIPSFNPRVHCQVCYDYDLCAICTLGECFNDQHLASHPVQLYNKSGTLNGEQPVLSHNTIMFTQSPSFAAHPSSPAHYTLPDGPSSPSPSLSPRSPGVVSEGRLPPGIADQVWQPFFLSDMTPTPTFTTLLDDIFTYLDSSNTSYLIPEAYSLFLDDLGYVGHENSWKANYVARTNASAESMADRSLKNVFDLFSIDHDVQQRTQGPFQGELSMYQSPGLEEGLMPLLTRKGFLDITTMEVLADPSRQWGNLSRVMRKYNLPQYRDWGDLPRSVLPDLPDPGTLQRFAVIQEVASAKAARDLASAQAVAMLAVQGSQNVLDLFTEGRRVYRYY